MNVADTLFDSFIHGLPSSFDGEENGTNMNNNDGCPSIDDVHGVFSMMQQQCTSDDAVGLAGTETASLSSQSSSSSLCDLQEHKHNIGNTISIVIGSPGEISVKPPAVVSSLENIYHLLFHDIHQLLAESAFDSHSSNQSIHQSSSQHQHARHYQSKRKREISVAPSPAPFDMEAILRAQQEFIQRRQLEETCNDKVRVPCTLPKRSRKRAPTSAQQHL